MNKNGQFKNRNNHSKIGGFMSSEITGVPNKVTFTLPNGMEVSLVPLRKKSLDAIDQWIKARYMHNVMEAIKDLSPELRKEMLFRATDKAAKISYQNQDGLDVLLESVHGMARVAYELIDKPTISFEQFDQMMFPDDGDILLDNYQNTYTMIFSVYGENMSSVLGEIKDSPFFDFVRELSEVFDDFGEEEQDDEALGE